MAPRQEPQRQTIGEIREGKENQMLAAGETPGEASAKASKLAISLRTSVDMDERLSALVRRQDSMTMHAAAEELLLIILNSNLAPQRKAKIEAKMLGTVLAELKASAEEATRIAEG
jgi:hypothetical protein